MYWQGHLLYTKYTQLLCYLRYTSSRYLCTSSRLGGTVLYLYIHTSVWTVDLQVVHKPAFFSSNRINRDLDNHRPHALTPYISFLPYPCSWINGFLRISGPSVHWPCNNSPFIQNHKAFHCPAALLAFALYHHSAVPLLPSTLRPLESI